MMVVVVYHDKFIFMADNRVLFGWKTWLRVYVNMQCARQLLACTPVIVCTRRCYRSFAMS